MSGFFMALYLFSWMTLQSLLLGKEWFLSLIGRNLLAHGADALLPIQRHRFDVYHEFDLVIGHYFIQTGTTPTQPYG